MWIFTLVTSKERHGANKRNYNTGNPTREDGNYCPKKVKISSYRMVTHTYGVKETIK